GKNVGTTPFSHTVYDGTFRVEMRKDRYESQTRSFEFDLWDLGDSKKTTFTLSPRPASLVLLPYLGDKSVTLADVRVRVNGEEVTRSPLSLEPGTYTLVAEKAEYISQTKVIELGPADNQAVEFRLKKPVVTVELKGYSNRSVYINGGFVGSARPKQIEVEVGPAPIEVKYKGRVEKTIPLVLHEGYRYIVETDRIVAQDALGNSYEVDLQTGQMNVSPGTLQVTSSPDRATLFLDGESLFRYTPDTLELEPGSYLLKMVKPGYQDFEQQVRVVSATVETVHHVFQQEVEDVRVRSSYVSEWGSSREETVFRSEDDGIQFSLVLENCFDAHSIEVQWIDPDGEMYKVQTISLSGDSDGVVSVSEGFQFSVDTTAKLDFFANPGTWTVMCYMDGKFLRSGLFKVLAPEKVSPLGTLSVSSSPSGASVYINGIKAPVTTPFQKQLAPGSYTVTLKKTGYKDASRTVELSDGETERVSVTLSSASSSPSQVSSSPSSTTPKLLSAYAAEWNIQERKELFTPQALGIEFALEMSGWNATHEVYGKWYTPDGSLFYDGSNNPFSYKATSDGRKNVYIGYDFIESPNIRDLIMDETGEWSIRVYLDDEYLTTVTFEVVTEASARRGISHIDVVTKALCVEFDEDDLSYTQKSSFATWDKKITLVVEFDDFPEGEEHILSKRWIDPDGGIFKAGDYRMDGFDDGDGWYWTWVDGDEFEEMCDSPGNWEVQFLMDGVLLFTLDFTMR
ncbi:MAG TPA: PEGA domain-containing protein, partial [Thermotogota bacterium]|nr:PEGA domain-containing protein [Thermotogota bacterium]